MLIQIPVEMVPFQEAFSTTRVFPKNNGFCDFCKIRGGKHVIKMTIFRYTGTYLYKVGHFSKTQLYYGVFTVIGKIAISRKYLFCHDKKCFISGPVWSYFGVQFLMSKQEVISCQLFSVLQLITEQDQYLLMLR